MIADLVLAFALLHPVHVERETIVWGGKVVRTWNGIGCGAEVTVWSETQTVILAVGYRGKWLKVFRVW